MTCLVEEAKATLNQDEEEFQLADLQAQEDEMDEVHKPLGGSDIHLSYI